MSESMMAYLLGGGLAYLIGAIPFGYLIGRARGVDIRTVGSHNIGATNVYRTVGHVWGFLAFFCDFLKGLLPVLLAICLRRDIAYLPLVVGLSAVIGHTFTLFMRFRGGKGVATAFGMLVGMMPITVGIAFAIFVVTVWLSHYISLGSCLAAIFLSVAVWFTGEVDLPIVKALVSLMTLCIVIKHRSNIVRLVKGTENKIY